MNFPSLKRLFENSVDALLRFPVTIFFAIIGFAVSFYLIENPNVKEAFWFVNAIYISLLGVPLSLGIYLMSEGRNFDFLKTHFFQLAIFVILMGYYFLLPEHWLMSDFVKAVIFTILAHLFVSISTYFQHRNLQTFWQYNRILFLRFVLAILFSAVLFLGLVLALFTIDKLFNTNIDVKTYGELWVFVASIFNTWFFVSQIPRNFEFFNNEEYPMGLKIFTQYILIPLVTIYLSILYVYIIQIIVEFRLPSGIVSYLVLGFSITGIFSLLMLYPIQEKTEHQWIRMYAKGFYWAIFPLIILLFVAIGVRINQYGLTVNRFFILLLALWLTGISIFMLVNRLKNIAIIPISLFCVLFLSTLGPTSAFNLSEMNQMSRLKMLLEKEELLKNGKIVKNSKTMSSENYMQIYNVVDYLCDYHGYKCFQEFFTEDLTTIFNDSTADSRYPHSKILELMGINSYQQSVFDTGRHENFDFFTFSSVVPNEKMVKVSDFDYYFAFNFYHYYQDSLNALQERSYELGNKDSLTISFSQKDNLLKIKRLKEKELVFFLDSLPKKLQKKHSDFRFYNVEKKDFTFSQENNFLKSEICFINIDGKIGKKSNKTIFSSFNLEILVKLKNRK